MIRRLVSSLACAAAAALLLAALPASAAADDAGLFAAYDGRQTTDLKAATDRYLRAVRRASRTGSARSLRRVIAADRALNRVLRSIGRGVSAQAPSSATGSGARTAALNEIRGWRRANNLEIRSVRAAIARRRATSERLLRRANRTYRRAHQAGRRAVARFGALGLSSPNGTLS